MTTIVLAALTLGICLGLGVGFWLSHTPSRTEPQASTPAPASSTWDRAVINAVEHHLAYEIVTSDGVVVQSFDDGYAWKAQCEQLRGRGYRFLHNGIDRT